MADKAAMGVVDLMDLESVDSDHSLDILSQCRSNQGSCSQLSSQSSLKEIIQNYSRQPDIRTKFTQRFDQGQLTRDEHPTSHFCVFFAGFDPEVKKIFLGHHIKADTWIFNGGHIDQGEAPRQTVEREMREEWGEQIGPYQILEPNLLTIKEIENPRSNCRLHYDIWYFVRLNYRQFNPNPELLTKEFYQFGWLDRQQAQQIIIDPPAVKGAELIFSELI
ncbi:MAG: NUDIX domain-containing protein [Candidatus Pacebacteria bacterium]|nr:NUDIX domain-containing protein [Candidatus Paceibacterota bacterium]